MPIVGLLLMGVVGSSRGGETADRYISFARDIRPLLSDRCFECHGPDRLTREADLRFDQRESVFGERDGPAIVVPGDPEASELIRRITTDDESEVMPPVDSGRSLSVEEKDLIRLWVEQGAEWEKHWAYIPPQRPELPETSDPSWPRNPIDHFVLARLEKAGLRPSPEAEHRSLIRRVTQDLTGLPPTPEEITEFLTDDSPLAYECVVDRLLQSPHYGERMTLPWLEASRYADTSGYQEDYGRYMYPWRTWVIDAFNDNMPFDRFVIEQMAGDLLPDATPEQVLATAYHRNHRINQEVGSIPEEFLVEYAVDRLETVGIMFLGSTLGCARCHDHKYDPISQKEYYQLYAFFNNIDEDGVDQASRFGFCKPFIEWPTEEQQAQLSAVQQRLDDLKEQQEPSAVEQTAYDDWLNEAEDLPPLGVSEWHSIGPFEHADATTQSGFDEPFLPEPDVDLAATYGELQWKQQPSWKDGVRQNLLGEYATFYITRDVFLPADMEFEFNFGVSDGYKFWIDGELFLERLAPGENIPVPEKISVPLAQKPHRLLIKLSNANFSQSFVFDPLGRETVPPPVFANLQRPPEERSREEQEALYAYFHGLRIAALEQELQKVKGAFAKVMVLKEREDVRPAHVLERGMYNQQGEPVERDTPRVLSAFPADQPRDRLGLARWLTSTEHPLTARVTVNRFWQMYFGAGLVKTAEDFGNQGEWPSHPDLLDWLATEFIDSGWDVKALQKLIVTSATYRQSSRMTPELRRIDPDNRLLARGPRFRLRPQFIRDQAIAVGGLLVRDIGGPSVKPYQPEGLWSDVSNLLLPKEWYLTNEFHQDEGANLYRRSLYTFWKRSVPPPGMTIFDAEAREVCSVRLHISNTPLQAMNLLNDPTYVEAARYLAHRMLSETGDTTSDRLTYGMELVTSRLPSAEEMTILQSALERHLAIYRDRPEAVKELLSHGESGNPGEHDPAEHAAYTQIGLLLLNLDETITKQ